MLNEFDSKKACTAIINTAPVVLGTSWRSVIYESTGVTFETLARWEKGSISPFAGHIIPRIECLAVLFSQATVEFGLAINEAHRFVDSWDRLIVVNPGMRSLETDEGYDLIARFGIAIFGTCWMHPLARYLKTEYDFEVTQGSFTVWKQSNKTTVLAVEVLRKLSAGEINRHGKMVEASARFKGLVDQFNAPQRLYRPIDKRDQEQFLSMAA